MTSDPIVDEIRNLREQRAARFGFDISLIVKDAQQRDAAGDREVIRRAPRRTAVPAKGKSKPAAKHYIGLDSDESDRR